MLKITFEPSSSSTPQQQPDVGLLKIWVMDCTIRMTEGPEAITSDVVVPISSTRDLRKLKR